MVKFTISIDIEAPVKTVFDYVTTGENFDKWNSAIRSIKKLSEGSKGPGT